MRLLAGTVAANRVAFGLGFLVAPKMTAAPWVGKVARRRDTTILTRAFGARDFALGAGALWALLSDRGSSRAWFAAQVVADSTDLAATLAARGDIPDSGYRLALAMAGASTAIAALGVAAGD